MPNHTSDQHAWFQAAVAAGRGSPERDRYLFRDGRGPGGDEPPNNWKSVFGGPSWTRVEEPDGSPGQWYYHLFAAEQPDLNWRNPEVVEEFASILRFWMDRGADGFRIDVSDALIKDDTFPDTATGEPIIPKDDDSPVHDVYREFRRVMDAYPGDRMAVIETGAEDDIVALFIRPDEMHLAFNFRFVHAGFDGPGLRAAIDSSLAANAGVGAPTTWVTDNHDTPRSVSRLGQNAVLTGAYVPGTMASGVFQEVDLELGTRRARALALVLLALPGAAYIYNGQELGLPNVDDLPDDVLQDPIWERSGRTVRGRDGCRVPMPWTTGRQPGVHPVPRQAVAADPEGVGRAVGGLAAGQRRLDAQPLPLGAGAAAHEPGPGPRRAALGVLARRGRRPARLRHGRRRADRAGDRSTCPEPRSTCPRASCCWPRSRWSPGSCPRSPRRGSPGRRREGIPAELGALVQLVADVIDPPRADPREGCRASSVARPGSRGPSAGQVAPVEHPRAAATSSTLSTMGSQKFRAPGAVVSGFSLSSQYQGEKSRAVSNASATPARALTRNPTRARPAPSPIARPLRPVAAPAAKVRATCTATNANEAAAAAPNAHHGRPSSSPTTGAYAASTTCPTALTSEQRDGDPQDPAEGHGHPADRVGQHHLQGPLGLGAGDRPRRPAQPEDEQDDHVHVRVQLADQVALR